MKRHVMKTIIDGVKISHCNKDISDFEWYFLDIDHLFNSVGGSVQPCNECVKVIVDRLSEEL